MKKSAQAQEEKPKIDEALAEIMIGFHFLAEERVIQVGMAGAIQMAIPLLSILAYYKTFEPTVCEKHFVRVIRSADSKYLSLQADKQNKKKTTYSIPPPANTFPKLPSA